MREDTEDLRRLHRLWDEHIHSPSPVAGSNSRQQEVALYASWLGGIVQVVLTEGSLDSNLAAMLQIRRVEGNQHVFKAAAELGEPARSYVTRLIAIEYLLAQLPVK